MNGTPNALALARRHADQLKEVPVPEWSEPGEAAFVIYGKAIKAAQYSSCKILATDGEGHFNEVKFAALVMEKCALNADGSRMFNPGDHLNLMEEADADTITRIGTMLVASKKSLRQLEKN